MAAFSIRVIGPMTFLTFAYSGIQRIAKPLGLMLRFFAVSLHERVHFVSRRHDGVFLDVLDHQMPGWRQIRTDMSALLLMFILDCPTFSFGADPSENCESHEK
jgi:hypothetical protein